MSNPPDKPDDAPGETLTAQDELVDEDLPPFHHDDDEVMRGLSGCEPRRYLRLSEHARGGLGRITRMRDRKLGRTVAVKELLQPTAVNEARFFREASITARLEHPGIVPIYEGGTWPDGTPFYAMKFVAGDSLRDRIEAAPSFRDRLALIPNVLAVAEAVAYAHSRGVVHRDLKPSNIMVGEYGETMVVDWGLAKVVTDESPEQPEVRGALDDGSEPVAAADLTVEGVILGTPAYMPPEQARGEPVDARADVYALGAILYTVLSGGPPYASSSSRATVVALLKAPPPPLTELVPVRPALAAIVAKAMARDVADRYPDASALRDDLARYQAGQLVRAHDYTLVERAVRWVKRARRPLIGAAILGLGGLAAFGLLRGPDALADLCKQSDGHAAEVWSASTRRQVRASLLATGVPFAADTADRVERALDDYVAAYAVARRRACNATAIEGEQSVELFDLRMKCLNDRLQDAAALVSVLSEADDVVVEDAANAATSLRPLAPCEDPEYLLARAKPPDDPDTARTVRGLEGDLARSWALSRAGRWNDASTLAADLVTRARATEHAPVIGDALRAHGSFLTHLNNQDPEAVEVLTEAYYASLRSGAFEDAFEAAAHLQAVLGTRLGEYDRAEHWAMTAEALIAQSGGNVYWSALVQRQRGDAAVRRGDYATSLSSHQQAVALLEASADPRNRRALAQALQSLGGSHLRLGHREDSMKTLSRSVAIIEELDGPRHPRLGVALNYLAQSYAANGDRQTAKQLMARSIDILTEVLGPDHAKLASPNSNQAVTLNRLGEYDAAYAHAKRARDIWEHHHGPNHRDVAYACMEMGKALRGKGDLAGARDLFERALEIRRGAYEPTHTNIADSAGYLASVLLDLGDLDRAAAVAADALAIERANAPTGRHTAAALERVGDIARARGAFAEARSRYREARDIFEYASDKARMQFRSATTLTGAKAVAGARAALAEAKTDDELDDELIAEIEAWLAEHATGQ